MVAGFGGTTVFVVIMAVAHCLHQLHRKRLRKKKQRDEEIARATRRSQGTLPNVFLSFETLPDTYAASLHVQVGRSPGIGFEEMEERTQSEGHFMTNLNDVHGQPRTTLRPPQVALTVSDRDTILSHVAYRDRPAEWTPSHMAVANAVARQGSVMSYGDRGYGQASGTLSPPQWQHAVLREGDVMSRGYASRHADRSAISLGLNKTSQAVRPDNLQEIEEVPRSYQFYDPVGRRTIYYDSTEQAFGY